MTSYNKCIITHLYIIDAVRQAAVTTCVVTNPGPVLTTSKPSTTRVRTANHFELKATRHFQETEQNMKME